MKKEKKSLLFRIAHILGIILGSLLLPILVINVIVIVKSYLCPDQVPTLFGITPMIVVTDSMNPTICASEMIVGEKVKAEEVEIGDIISFFDPLKGANTSVITHRVTEIYTEENVIYFKTKGDANNQGDQVPVPESKLLCKYKCTIPYVGEAALFLRTKTGILLFILLPLMIFMITGFYRNKKEAREKDRTILLLESRCQSLEEGSIGGGKDSHCRPRCN